ncbi:MAG: FIST signal transduction protein [Solirubrobacteraceae bacterium]
MSVRIGCGLSTGSGTRSAAIGAAHDARAALDGRPADLAFAFCSGAHLADPEQTMEGVLEALAPPLLVGCGASGVLGAGREIERDTAVAVWAASLDGGRATVFEPTTPGSDAAGARAVVLLCDPHLFGADAVFGAVAEEAPGAPVLGGIASARAADSGAALFLDGHAHHGGAVGVGFHDVEVLPCVSQGAVPVGPELTVTAADGHVVHELAGRPALGALRRALEQLSDHDAALVARGSGLLLGVVIDPGRPEHGAGDFLVRAIVSADGDTGSVTVGAPVQTGTVVRIHARDAASADSELREALALRAEALGSSGAAGALLFSCNGRGRRLFGVPDHDARLLDTVLGGAPAAGFFAAGEIGPVGGAPFLHGFTATVAVFAA